MEARHWRAVAILALLASPALAQQEEEVARFGSVGLGVQGGLHTYTGLLGGVTNAGAYLGVQADVQALRWVGVEVGYEGAYNTLIGGAERGALWRHGFGALVKVGPVLDGWRPYAGAGVGVSYINPTREAEAQAYEDDFLLEVPFAAGVDYQLGGVTLGVRATFRILDGEDFGPADRGDLFTAGALVGWRF